MTTQRLEQLREKLTIILVPGLRDSIVAGAASVVDMSLEAF